MRNKLARCLFCKLSHFVYVLFVESRTSLHTPPLCHFSPETRNATRFFVPFSPRLSLSLSLSLHVQGISGGRKRESCIQGKKARKGEGGGTRLMALVSRRQERRRRSEPPPPPPWSEEAKEPLPPIRSFLQPRMPDSPKQLLLQA